MPPTLNSKNLTNLKGQLNSTPPTLFSYEFNIGASNSMNLTFPTSFSYEFNVEGINRRILLKSLLTSKKKKEKSKKILTGDLRITRSKPSSDPSDEFLSDPSNYPTNDGYPNLKR